MASFRMAYKTRGVKEFLFVSHRNLKTVEEMEELQQRDKKSLWSRMQWSSNQSLKESSALKSEVSIEVEKLKAAAEKDVSEVSDSIQIEQVEEAEDHEKVADSSEFLEPKNYDNIADYFKKSSSHADNELMPSGLEAPIAASVLISVSGWITSLTHVVEPWLYIAELRNGVPTEHFSLCWETKELLVLGKAVETILTTEVLGIATTQALGRTILGSFMYVLN